MDCAVCGSGRMRAIHRGGEVVWKCYGEYWDTFSPPCDCDYEFIHGTEYKDW
jgi:hypothetical protein